MNSEVPFAFVTALIAAKEPELCVIVLLPTNCRITLAPGCMLTLLFVLSALTVESGDLVSLIVTLSNTTYRRLSSGNGTPPVSENIMVPVVSVPPENWIMLLSKVSHPPVPRRYWYLPIESFHVISLLTVGSVLSDFFDVAGISCH